LQTPEAQTRLQQSSSTLHAWVVRAHPQRAFTHWPEQQEAALVQARPSWVHVIAPITQTMLVGLQESSPQQSVLVAHA
jgi:hypothetical protein